MPEEPAEDVKAEKIEILELLVFLFIRGDIDLRYGDESSFSLQPNVPYGWTKKGNQKGIPSRKGGRLNIFGLMNLAGNLTTYQTKSNVNTATIIDWIEDFAQSIKMLTVIVLDNAPWHRSKEFMAKIKEWEDLGLFIFHLPTYSPHLNPIEILWKRMKYKGLEPKDYLSEEILHQKINHILKNYNSDKYKIHFDTNKRC